MLKITVEPCIDADCFVWSILDYMGGVIMDGYEETAEEAWAKAREERNLAIEEGYGGPNG